MLANFLGYEIPKPEEKKLTPEEHGKRLIDQLMGMRSG
jgi:hypothetical protein